MQKTVDTKPSMLELDVQAKPVCSPLRKRIGSTVYDVNVYFELGANETMDDIILRLIRSDLNQTENNTIISFQQKDKMSERCSI